MTQQPAQTWSREGISLGQPFGVPLRLSTSWFIGAAVIAWVMIPATERWLGIEGPWAVVVGVSFAVLLGLSVLAHELAHAVVGQRFGLQVRSMTIHLIGGVTSMEAETRRPWVDFVIALAGPLTSLAVGLLSWAAFLVAPGHTVFSFIAWQLTIANLIVGVLNLVPALPLDGGRLLRDVVWAFSGREDIGTLAAGWTGRGFAVLLAVLALLPSLLGSTDIVWLAWGMFLAFFVWVEASRSLSYATLTRRLRGVSVGELARPILRLPESTSVAVALGHLGEQDRRMLVSTDNAGHLVGVVSPESVEALPVERRPWVPISSVSLTVGDGPTVPSSLEANDFIKRFGGDPRPIVFIADPAGAVQGVLIVADLNRFFRHAS